MEHLKNIEVELKFPLLNSEDLIKKLNLITKTGKQADFQQDTYYNASHRDFLAKKPVSEWLRLRESSKGFSLNYKNWHTDSNVKTTFCDEYETKVENIDAVEKILKCLDFKPLIVVDKKRSIWLYKNTEIAIDEVKELGFFLEIEAKGNFATVEEAREQLYLILEEIEANVGEQDFEGYPFLLLKKKGLLV